MEAVVLKGEDIVLEEVAGPQIKDPFGRMVRKTTSAICGADLHMIHGTMTSTVVSMNVSE